MHADCGPRHEHSHAFGQDHRKAGERRTLIVILITGATMVVEIIAGLAYGSMALLADGLHMASHTVALGIAVFAYVYARRHARDGRFSFGTGKVNALGGFTGAVLLAVFALYMAYESMARFLSPVSIAFDQAILVACAGLVVNIVSVFILGGHHDHDHGHGHGHGHGHDHDQGHDHGHSHAHDAAPHAHDHNLRSAYLHVLADALTSLTAIFALLAGKHAGLHWMDPAMGILGSLLVARWSYGLLRQTSGVLLDRQAPDELLNRIRRAVPLQPGDAISDLHVWSIGPGALAAHVTIVTDRPASPDAYRERIPHDLGIAHASIEVIPCEHARAP